MPGPKMGPRPADFDETVVKQAPTYIRWAALKTGEKLRYACRDFVKGKADDEERLMRRIMIARRNNLRDHELLKKARDVGRSPPGSSKGGKGSSGKRARAKKDEASDKADPAPSKKIRTAATAQRSMDGVMAMTDAEIRDEMDMPAVEATRSYKAWLKLDEGEEFTYNQRYIKGKEGHDWLLKKNIWRRMRYRRENKRMVEQLKGDEPEAVAKAAEAAHGRVTARNPTSRALAAAVAAKHEETPPLPTPVIEAVPVGEEEEEDEEEGEDEEMAGEDAALAAVAAASSAEDFVHKAVVEAAVKAAESYVQKAREESAAAAGAASDAVGVTESSVLETHADIIAAATRAAVSEVVNNPIMAGATASDGDEEVEDESTLEVAAKLAAAVEPPEEGGGEEEEGERGEDEEPASVSV